jgi:phage terminase large subunit-like protein
MRYFPITIGIDAGILRDSTAMVGVAYDSKRGKVGVVFHKIWRPSPGDPIDIEVTLENELRKLYNEHKFIISSIVYDPKHLLPTMMKLQKEGFPTRVFDQTTSNMIAASQLLYELMKSKNLEAYPDDDIRRHIQMSVAEQTARGFRIVKTKVSKRHHIDAAIALAMAAYDAVVNGGVDTSIPLVIESPWSDMSMHNISKETVIPFPLQGDND